MPNKNNLSSKHKKDFGLVLIVLGVIFLLGNFKVPIFSWLVALWPLLLIYWGLRISAYQHKADCVCYFCKSRKGKNNSENKSQDFKDEANSQESELD